MKQMAFDNTMMNEKQKIGDVTVRKYLPYQEKIELAAEVIRCALETDDESELMFMSFKETLFLTYYVMKYYTDFNVDDDPVGTYDYVMSTGLYEEIFECIHQD